MRTSDEIKDLAKALSLAKPKIGAAEKNSENPFVKSKYADINAYITASTESLSEQGLVLVQGTDLRDGKSVLVSKLMHSSGQWIESVTPLIVPKNDMQGLGAAITYARRYAMAALLCMGAEDDDGESNKLKGGGQIKTGQGSSQSGPSDAEKKEAEKQAAEKQAKEKHAAEKYAETIEGVLMTGDVMNVVASKEDQSWIERLCHSYPDTGKALLNKVSKAAKAKLDQSPDSEVAAFLNSAAGNWLDGIVKHYLPDVYQEFEMEVASRVQKEAA